MRAIVLIDQYLADSRNSHTSKEKKPVTSDHIELCNVDTKYDLRIRDMIHHHKAMWNDCFGNKNLQNTRLTLKKTKDCSNLLFIDQGQLLVNTKHSNSKNNLKQA